MFHIPISHSTQLSDCHFYFSLNQQPHHRSERRLVWKSCRLEAFQPGPQVYMNDGGPVAAKFSLDEIHGPEGVAEAYHTHIFPLNMELVTSEPLARLEWLSRQRDANARLLNKHGDLHEGVALWNLRHMEAYKVSIRQIDERSSLRGKLANIFQKSKARPTLAKGTPSNQVKSLFAHLDVDTILGKPLLRQTEGTLLGRPKPTPDVKAASDVLRHMNEAWHGRPNVKSTTTKPAMRWTNEQSALKGKAKKSEK